MLARIYTPGRASQARHVEGQRADKVAVQSLLSLYFPIFLSFYFPILLLINFPIFVLFSSIYNLFALLGRKAHFTPDVNN